MDDYLSKPLRSVDLRDTISRVVKSGCIGYGAAKVGYRPMFSTPLEKDTDNEIPIDPETMLPDFGYSGRAGR
jgi:hypothetical protein